MSPRKKKGHGAQVEFDLDPRRGSQCQALMGDTLRRCRSHVLTEPPGSLFCHVHTDHRPANRPWLRKEAGA